MITSNERVIKVSFYFKPNDIIRETEDMRNVLCDTLGAFNIYDLRTKDTTIEKEEKNESR